MQDRKYSAVIAIGSELISGQIINRNAAWISDHLYANGIETRCHLTVDDRIDEIIEAIKYAGHSADYIFVTGGLGPTSDDITRNAVAKFAELELVYDENSWDAESH